MAQIEVKVPQLSESVAEATLLKWHKKIGEIVFRDENLIDIETDKVVLELPAPEDGILSHIVKTDGATVTAGEVIALLNTDVGSVQNINNIETHHVIQSVNQSISKSNIAMPAAAKLLTDHNISTSHVVGTGKDGRITKKDVLTSLEILENATSNILNVSEPSTPIVNHKNLEIRLEERVPMSRLRIKISERLLNSQANSATLTTFNEINMQFIINLRNKYKEQFEKIHKVKLGFMSFFVKAVLAALKKYPIINASVSGNDIVYHNYFDIGVAVSSSRGLVVPILRDVDKMSMVDIENKISEFSQKAKDGKLSIEELTGGTFTISNGGIFGSMLSTPIINPPQSAILGIHYTKDRAIVENNEIVIRPINYFALSYDHRIIDGREAVLSLMTIKNTLEDPARLLLDI